VTKDYAKKRRLRRSVRSFRAAPSSTQEELLPTWLWLTAGALLGLGLSFLAYWKLRSPHPVPTITISGMIEEEKKETPKTDFDFYTVLPNMPSTDLPETTAAVASSASSSEKKPLSSSSSHENYILQVGSFRQVAQAESLKAQLALSGIQASIQTFKLREGETWYRVYLGPFSSRQQALSSQAQLTQSFSSHSLILKISV